MAQCSRGKILTVRERSFGEMKMRNICRGNLVHTRSEPNDPALREYVFKRTAGGFV